MALNFGPADVFFSTQLKRKFCSVPHQGNPGFFHIFKFNRSYVRQDGTHIDYYLCRECFRLSRASGAVGPRNRLQSVMLNGNNFASDPNVAHIHNCQSVDEAKVKAMKLQATASEHCRQGIKRPLQAHSDMTAGVVDVEDDPAQQDAIILHLKTYHAQRSSLYRHTTKASAPVPDPYNLDPNLRTTLRGAKAPEHSPVRNEAWCIYSENNMLIFASDEDLDQLWKSKYWVADGTFKYCPSSFELYTVLGYVTREDGSSTKEMVPLVHDLLPNKSAATYTTLFTTIKNRFEELNPAKNANDLKFNALLDFEVASRNSIIAAFLSATLMGCTFHLGQAV